MRENEHTIVTAMYVAAAGMIGFIFAFMVAVMVMGAV